MSGFTCAGLILQYAVLCSGARKPTEGRIQANHQSTARGPDHGTGRGGDTQTSVAAMSELARALMLTPKVKQAISQQQQCRLR